MSRYGIAADDGHARLGAALFGPDHMDDAVARIAHGEKLNLVLGDIALKRLELQPGLGIGDGGNPQRLAFGGRIVVSDGQSPVRTAYAPAVGAETAERLR